jgi:[acyl-carrier-protein] S-malonyltransferase
MSKIALLFPGQGSHFVGMGQDIYNEYAVAKTVFEEANDVLGFDIKKICFSGNLMELNSMENMFPGLYIVCMALFKVYIQEVGVAPQFLAGHSLGEYAALTCSGGLTFADGLRVIHRRGVLAQAVADEGEGTMTIIEGIDINIAETECKKVSGSGQYVAVSCYNSPDQIAISGYQDAVVQVEDRLVENGAKISPILTAPPIHSLLMKEVAEQLEVDLKKCKFNELKWPVVANVDAQPYGEPDSILAKLKLQLTNPVQWLGTIQYMEKQGVTTFIEIGPQAVLASLLKTFIKNVTAISCNDRGNRQSLARALASK